MAGENTTENRLVELIEMEMMPTYNLESHLVELMEKMPAFNLNYRRRFREACLILHSAVAFSKARDDDDHRVNLLQQPNGEIVVDVIIEPEYSSSIAHLARLKDLVQLHSLGGVTGVASCLGTDPEKGIHGNDEEITRRRIAYGSNKIYRQFPKILHILLETITDPIILVLLICAFLALSFGIKRHGKAGLSDGVSIVFGLILVIGITAVSNLWPKVQLFKISKATDEFNIPVRRNSRCERISVSEIVVGDVVSLKAGDQVPADGLYLKGNTLEMDESNVGDHIASVEVDDGDDYYNPFLLSRTKVIKGSASMLVTAVGTNTEWGKMVSMKTCHSEQTTPLQKRLREFTKLIAKTGVMVASIVVVVLLFRYFIGNLRDDDGKPHFVPGKTHCSQVLGHVIGILATPVAIASTSIPEGLLLAVLIAIAFSTKKMTNLNAQVKNLSACEAIGTTTVICMNETCNLTSDHLAVTEFCFGDKYSKGPSSSEISGKILGLLHQIVFWTGLEDSSDNQIKNAIQKWGDHDLDLDFEKARANYTIHLPQVPNSERTQTFTWIKDRTDDSLHAHQKGAAEAILPVCSHYYDGNGNIKDMDNSFRENVEKMVREMESKGLQCIAFAHRNMSKRSNEEDGDFEHLVFVGAVGMTYPCPSDVRKAVKDCIKAQFDIKILTRNDALNAKAAAIQCGILEVSGDLNTGEVVEGHEFRAYDDSEKLRKCKAIRVMARASTLDKLCMVQCLKEKGEVVAVTGGTTGDADVLREADVGLLLGTKGTQQAKENSDIIILEDKFDSLARVLTWGRAMYLKIQLYAQFQLAVSISSLVIDFVIAVTATEPPTFNMVTTISSGKVPFATLQLLWVKLIVGTLAAVAITVEEPAELGQLPRFRRDQPFITTNMWRIIAGQALYPIIILLTIQFKGQSALKLDSREKNTMIFNTFVLWQLCVILNTKGIERSIFEGMLRRKLLWGIIGLIFLLQVMIVELLHKFADTKPLTWEQWIICVVIAFLAWPYGWLIQNVKCSWKNFFPRILRH